MPHRITRQIEDGKPVSYISIPLGFYRQQCETIRLLKELHHGKLAEFRVAELVGGTVSPGYADAHDVLTRTGKTLQVKSANPTDKRWSFSNAHTECDWLVLTAQKDDRFSAQYLDDSPWVYWLIRRSEVPQVVRTSGYIQISTNPDVWSNRRMVEYMVPEARIVEIE
ncbi:hypothetical protein CMPELA_31070 [Cupriavidus necator]|uniref:Uncharacterized protein n=1 Tax=Cupriavidus necator (strain ATCC 17699 / DSM 428 / KCTC 22496 / NCIMB 10442 / H16 / Stanier 337) TaxID=381666 RepID=Q0JYK5_CUPNH|nr:hypothetical protein [Cupriavidus necator]QCC04940.1 hypothetical protein E6A55_31235 [Cupriavidus necator H16]QQB79627.1 hypothetical protein I6H87_30785 [Cupriavidus necator]WKA43870.1 hypothetical protein QWP09_31265 [Cupriavidus necator]CAJ97169.1 Hypothetical protein H16_B2387 [Cupriavidus necator H16]